MSGDYSRHRFDPNKHFSGVLMQQGRVQLDADWNEGVEILDRRLRAGITDIMGRCVVPKETPNAFKIEISGTDSNKQMTIGAGRIYVDGLLAENYGGHPTFDKVLAEARGTEAVFYDAQPYFPNAPLLPTSGLYLVYLDVWQREVTHLEVPALIEPAIGVDTTARLQTVWQVKIHPLPANATVTCATDDDKIPGWLDTTRPSAGRLTTEAVDVATDPSPCLIPPGSGYRGLENQLYRVEIHNSGPAETATFKWSRENASVATTVKALDGGQITVDRVKWDSIRRFSPGNWIELTDDWREFSGQPGVMRKIMTVDDTTQVITLEQPLTPQELAMFPSSGSDHLTDSTRHTRIRRWDQQGKVRKADGSPFYNLDPPVAGVPAGVIPLPPTGISVAGMPAGMIPLLPTRVSVGGVPAGGIPLPPTGISVAGVPAGVIPVPPSGTPIILEHGVQITFTTDPNGGKFRTGDYWTFAARIATGSAKATIEELKKAPPRGIHHHYGRLALVTFPLDLSNQPTTCRVLWPPDAVAEGGEGCECTVCVTADSHNTGTLTIQAAIDKVKPSGGTVCLGSGYYVLGSSLHINGAESVRVRGHGWKTVLMHQGVGSAVISEQSFGVTIEDVMIMASARSPAITLRNCMGVTLQRCIVLHKGDLAHTVPVRSGGGLAELPESPAPAIGLSGWLFGTILRENVLIAATGIASMVAERTLRSYLLTAGFYADDNFLW